MMGYTPITSEERHRQSLHPLRLIPACIILRSNGWHYAVDGDCAMIGTARGFEEIDRVVRNKGYAPVSSNSLCAAMIRDSLRLRGYDANEAVDDNNDPTEGMA